MIGAIIQARMGSSRCPSKTLRELGGKTLLERVVNRAKQCQMVDEVIVATTVNPEDDVILDFCTKRGIKCFRGSSDDVLSRYYLAAKKYGVDVIVRITADDPFKDPDVIDALIRKFNQGNYQYVSNTIKPTYPEGLDAEVFSFESLHTAYTDAKLPSEREHVTPYIWKNPNLFRIFNFENDIDLSHLRWTVDHDEDFEFVESVLAKLEDSENFRMNDILDVLEKYPHISEANNKFVRNEGYIKSVREETAGGDIK